MANQSAILVVSARIIQGRDEEFNKWYDERHIPNYASKIPYLRAVRRFYSKKGNPQSIAIYEYSSMDDLKKSLSSRESKAAGDDADSQIGKLAQAFDLNAYVETYRKSSVD